MRRVNLNYPHPVLSADNNDYIDCKFDISIDGEPSVVENEIKICLHYSLNANGLLDLVKEEKAKVFIYCESVNAEYRKVFAFDNDKQELEICIDSADVNMQIVLMGYIIATKKISPFQLPEHNKDIFDALPFEINNGDILAIGEEFIKIPLTNYDPLADRPSIFAIMPQYDNPNEEVFINLEGHKINIMLNENTYNKYKDLYAAPELRTTLASFFAAPVLVDVLSCIKKAGQDELESWTTKKWYQVIVHRMKELNIDLLREDSLIRVANRILPHIFNTGISELAVVFKETVAGGKDEN